MFWGLIVHHDKQYSHKVETSFHVSMAMLDVSTAGKTPVELMVTVGEESYMMCRLSKEHSQQQLDLNFSVGEDIIFFSKKGEGIIHMTGYNLEGEDLDDFEEESEEESEEEKIDTPKPQSNKRKTEVPTPESSKKIKTDKGTKKKPSLEDSESDEDLSDPDMSDLDDEEMDEMLDEEAGEEESDESSEEEAVETPTKKGKTPQKQTPALASGKKNKNQQKTPLSMPKEQAPKYLGTPYPGKGTDKKPSTPMTNGTESEKKKKKKNKNKKKDSMGGSPALEQPKSQKKFIKGGIALEDMKVGTGPDVAKGKFVQIYYEGRLKDSGKVFDSNKEGKGFKFKLGAGEVIKGMEFGLDGMKVGGRRKLTIPPKMGYGHQGAGKDIPPNSTLEFDIELKAVN